MVDDALALARRWCDGHIIDDAPALAHAVKVALTVDRYYPGHPAELTAAVLLHDSPEFAPRNIGLDQVLTSRFGAETCRVVRNLERFHAALDSGRPVNIDPADTSTTRAVIADKIVAFDSLLSRARASGDGAAFWAKHTAFRNLLPEFRLHLDHATPHIPQAMAAELDRLITNAETAVGKRTNV